MSYAIGHVPDNLPEEMRQWCQQVNDLLRGLFVGSVAPGSGAPGGTTSTGGSSATAPTDTTPPPTISDVDVQISASPLAIIVQTGNPTWTTGGGQRLTRVYGAQYGGVGPLPTFAAAVVVHEFVGQIGAFEAENTENWHLWLTWVANNGQESTAPAGGVNGFTATAEAVDDANIVNLSAAKLSVGDGTVGGNLKSSNYSAGTQGWILTPAGYFEASNGLFRGSLDVRSALTGERLTITNSQISVYDAAGVLRVRIGSL